MYWKEKRPQQFINVRKCPRWLESDSVIPVFKLGVDPGNFIDEKLVEILLDNVHLYLILRHLLFLLHPQLLSTDWRKELASQVEHIYDCDCISHDFLGYWRCATRRRIDFLSAWHNWHKVAPENERWRYADVQVSIDVLQLIHITDFPPFHPKTHDTGFLSYDANLPTNPSKHCYLLLPFVLTQLPPFGCGEHWHFELTIRPSFDVSIHKTPTALSANCFRYSYAIFVTGAWRKPKAWRDSFHIAQRSALVSHARCIRVERIDSCINIDLTLTSIWVLRGRQHLYVASTNRSRRVISKYKIILRWKRQHSHCLCQQARWRM